MFHTSRLVQCEEHSLVLHSTQWMFLTVYLQCVRLIFTFLIHNYGHCTPHTEIIPTVYVCFNVSEYLLCCVTICCRTSSKNRWQSDTMITITGRGRPTPLQLLKGSLCIYTVRFFLAIYLWQKFVCVCVGLIGDRYTLVRRPSVKTPTQLSPGRYPYCRFLLNYMYILPKWGYACVCLIKFRDNLVR